MKLRVLGVVCIVVAMGCSQSDVPDGVIDNRVPIPESDPNFIDLITPERIIPPYTEEQWCLYADNSEDIAVNDLQAFQGDYGHHLVLLSTFEPKQHGTWEQCTEFEDMENLRALVLPLELPAGYAVNVPADSQYVLQMHYVNAGSQPLLVRDVARLRKAATVEEWAATFTLNDGTLNIPNTENHSESFDCTTQADLDLMFVGGHMHEAGSKFEFLAGPDVDNLTSLYLVDPWEDQYRDAPPIELYVDAPLHLAAGTILRTTCEWSSTAFEPIGFPEEMCAAFGYVGGTKDIYYCEDGTVVDE